MVKQIKESEFKEFTEQKGLVLISLSANWCGPCRMEDPVLEDLSGKMAINIGRVDIDQELLLTSKFHVSTIPTLLLYKDGEMLNKSVGYKSFEDLKTWIKDNESY